MSLLKEVGDKGGTTAWCPLSKHGDVMAIGTRYLAGSGFDDYGGELAFVSSNLQEPGTELREIAKTKTSTRFNCLAWGKSGGDMGILAGGMQNGIVNLWDPTKLCQSGDDGEPIAVVEKHKAKVGSMEFNPHSSMGHLLATGADDKEVFIVDIKNSSKPTVYSPGVQKHAASVTSVAWNPQVAHIMSSASSDGVCTVWDLRKKAPWCELRDPKGSGFSDLAWKPDGGVYLVTATDDDSRPVLRLWDLRRPNSYLSELKGHTKGIYSISWCPQDSSLLVSCGKDNKTILWDMFNAAPVFELNGEGSGDGSGNSAAGNLNNGLAPSGLSFGGENAGSLFGSAQTGPTSMGNRRYQVQWSPARKTLLSTCSLDRKVQVFSMNGAGSGSDQDLTGDNGQPIRKHAPRWCGRRCGATFGFGGKLIRFGAANAAAGAGDAQAPTFNPEVTLCEYLTEPQLVTKAQTFDQTVSAASYHKQVTQQQVAEAQVDAATAAPNESFKKICEQKAANAKTQEDKDTWNFISVLFDSDAREQILGLLGFDAKEISRLVPPILANRSNKSGDVPTSTTEAPLPAENNVAAKPGGDGLNEWVDTGVQQFPAGEQAAEDLFSGKGAAVPVPIEQDTAASAQETVVADTDSAAPLQREESFAIESKLSQLSVATELSDTTAAFENEPIVQVTAPPKDVEDVLRKALLIGNFQAAVDCCFANGLLADALLLATCGGPEIWAKTQAFYLEKQCEVRPLMKVVSTIISGNFEQFVQESEIANGKWQEVLAILASYTESNDFPRYCSKLADRLLAELGPQGHTPATICYLCAVDVEKTLNIWVAQAKSNVNQVGVEALQELVEKTVVFQNALPDPQAIFSHPDLLQEYVRYAERLATEGQLAAAANYLAPLNIGANPSQQGIPPELLPGYQMAAELSDRISKASVKARLFQVDPTFPFDITMVGVAPAAAAVPAQPQTTAAQQPNAQQQQQQQHGFNAAQSGMNQNQQYNNNSFGQNNSSYQYGQQQQQWSAPQPTPTPSYQAPSTFTPQAPAQPAAYANSSNWKAPTPAPPAPAAYTPAAPAPYANPQPPPAPAAYTPAPPAPAYSAPSPASYGGATSYSNNPPTAASYQQSAPTPASYNQAPQPSYSPAPPAAPASYSPAAPPASTPSYSPVNPPQSFQGAMNPAPLPPPATSQPSAPRAPGSGPVIKENDGFGSTAGNPEAGRKYGNYAPQPVVAAPQAAPEPEKPAVLPGEMKPVVDGFQSLIDRLRGVASGSENRQVDEGAKALAALNEKLCRNKVSDDVKAKLLEMAECFNNNNFARAKQINVELTTRDWAEHKDWLKGTKYMIQLAEKRLVQQY